jgi:hypothetical protein
MHNFGRGMWRRISDYQKQQEQPIQQQPISRLDQYLQYLQMQKQRAIDAYRDSILKKESVTVVTESDLNVSESVVEPVIESVSESVIESVSESVIEYVDESHPVTNDDFIIVENENVVNSENINQLTNDVVIELVSEMIISEPISETIVSQEAVFSEPIISEPISETIISETTVASEPTVSKKKRKKNKG